MEGRRAKSRDDAVVTLEEALSEAPAVQTLFWGARLGALARKTARQVPVRWVSSETVGEAKGVTREVTLCPTAGPETRIVMAMPRSRDELKWRLQVAAHLLADGAEDDRAHGDGEADLQRLQPARDSGGPPVFGLLQ